MPAQSWAEQLKHARAGLTQEAAARRINRWLPLATLRDWEQGRRTPPRWVQELILWRLRLQR